MFKPLMSLCPGLVSRSAGRVLFFLILSLFVCVLLVLLFPPTPLFFLFKL